MPSYNEVTNRLLRECQGALLNGQALMPTKPHTLYMQADSLHWLFGELTPADLENDYATDLALSRVIERLIQKEILAGRAQPSAN